MTQNEFMSLVEYDTRCGCSGDDFGSVNVEAFEVTGELYCDDCADEAIGNATQEDGE